MNNFFYYFFFSNALKQYNRILLKKRPGLETMILEGHLLEIADISTLFAH